MQQNLQEWIIANNDIIIIKQTHKMGNNGSIGIRGFTGWKQNIQHQIYYSS